MFGCFVYVLCFAEYGSAGGGDEMVVFRWKIGCVWEGDGVGVGIKL
jgi:hypothetical protein